nr:MAG TPA: hypothetical protein [Caudoviricetes sp.]
MRFAFSRDGSGTQYWSFAQCFDHDYGAKGLGRLATNAPSPSPHLWLFLT